LVYVPVMTVISLISFAMIYSPMIFLS